MPENVKIIYEKINFNIRRSVTRVRENVDNTSARELFDKPKQCFSAIQFLRNRTNEYGASRIHGHAIARLKLGRIIPARGALNMFARAVFRQGRAMALPKIYLAPTTALSLT